MEVGESESEVRFSKIQGIICIKNSYNCLCELLSKGNVTSFQRKHLKKRKSIFGESLCAFEIYDSRLILLPSSSNRCTCGSECELVVWILSKS